jgi:quercetin dioxygenase-like cupin family protein
MGGPGLAGVEWGGQMSDANAGASQTGRLVYADAARAQSYYMVGDSITVLHGGAGTEGRFEFVVAQADPGGGPPLHTHPEAELFVVLEGELQFTSYVDGELQTIVGQAGDCVIVPGGTPHTFTCDDPAGARFVFICLPAGREQFFAEAGVPVTPATRAQAAAAPPDLDRIMAAAGRHGLSLWDSEYAWHGPGAHYFSAAETQADTRRIAGEVFHIAGEFKHDSGGFILVDNSSQRGAAVPMHTHHQPEVFYVLEGEYEFGTLDDEGRELTFRAGPGAAVYIPANAPHSFRNLAAGPSRGLACFHGTDVRGFFELGVPVRDREEQLSRLYRLDMDELAPILAGGARYGMQF